MDAEQISRSVYTVFDALGSAGGVQAVLLIMAEILVGI